MAKELAKLAWLHLSDLHIGHPHRKWDAKQVLDTLEEGVKDAVRAANVTPQFLFFTGDLGFGELKNKRGSRISDQLKIGVDLLETLRTAVEPEIARENVFVVPGNHDLNRNLVTKADREWLRDPRRTMSDVQLLFQMRSHDWRSMSLRQKAFRDILSKHFKYLNANVDDATYAVLRSIGIFKIGIAGFNSAWSCSEDNEKGKLWMAGAYQAESLLAKLHGSDFRIALIHHPGNWFTESDELDFWRSRIQGEFDVCLHGHEHTSWVSGLQTGHVTIAAGATYEESHKPTGFNLTVVNLENRSGFVHLMTYNAKGRAWQQEVIPRYTDDAGNWALEKIGLVAQTRESIADLVAKVHAPRRGLNPSKEMSRWRGDAPKDFKDILDQLNDVNNKTRSLVDFATSIGITMGISKEDAFIASVKVLTGLVSAAVNEKIEIAVIGPRIEGTRLICDATSGTRRPNPSNTQPRSNADVNQMIRIIRTLIPNVVLSNYVVMREGSADSVALYQAIENIGSSGDAQLVLIPLSASESSEDPLYEFLGRRALDRHGVVHIVPRDFYTPPNRSSPADEVACRVVDESGGSGSLTFPGHGLEALAVACAFVAGILSALKTSGTSHSGRAILRALYDEATQRPSTQPPTIQRVLELLRQP